MTESHEFTHGEKVGVLKRHDDVKPTWNGVVVGFSGGDDRVKVQIKDMDFPGIAELLVERRYLIPEIIQSFAAITLDARNAVKLQVARGGSSPAIVISVPEQFGPRVLGRKVERYENVFSVSEADMLAIARACLTVVSSPELSHFVDTIVAVTPGADAFRLAWRKALWNFLHPVDVAIEKEEPELSATLQRPAISRQVHYVLDEDDAGDNAGKHRPATITSVNDDGSVNISVFLEEDDAPMGATPGGKLHQRAAPPVERVRNVKEDVHMGWGSWHFPERVN